MCLFAFEQLRKFAMTHGVFTSEEERVSPPVTQSTFKRQSWWIYFPTNFAPSKLSLVRKKVETTNRAVNDLSSTIWNRSNDDHVIALNPVARCCWVLYDGDRSPSLWWRCELTIEEVQMKTRKIHLRIKLQRRKNDFLAEARWDLKLSIWRRSLWTVPSSTEEKKSLDNGIWTLERKYRRKGGKSL